MSTKPVTADSVTAILHKKTEDPTKPANRQEELEFMSWAQIRELAGKYGVLKNSAKRAELILIILDHENAAVA